MEYRINPGSEVQNYVTLVGCGGTGGFVAEGLCRLLPKQTELLFVDHDRVEPHNLRRQAFYAGDVGKFKAQVLAERLARQHGRIIGYSVKPYSADIYRDSSLGAGFRAKVVRGLLIGCVDNSQARRAIAESLTWGTWWLDSGNGQNSGQVLFGNARTMEDMPNTFNPETGLCRALPCPAMQLPALLAPTPVKRRDCAQAVADDDQSPVINQAMATILLEFVRRIIKKEISWMGAYLDLDAGSLRTVPATPETVAQMLNCQPDTVTDFGCHNRQQMRVQV